jgi:protein-L-isoaspartate(D-aspartate) O-methyltransferase
MNEDLYKLQRIRMVEDQILSRGIKDEIVLRAMMTVPRHLFVLPELRDQSYEDHPLPIGFGQTISQPYIVALMTELLELSGSEKVLEIGSGSGYQAAVLSFCARDVVSMERIPELAMNARSTINMLSYDSVHIIEGNGYTGYKDRAPYDRIILTAAPPQIPEELIDQLDENGIMCAPVGEGVQKLIIGKKKGGNFIIEDNIFVRFVPMIDKV